MALRLIEVVLDQADAPSAHEVIREQLVHDAWLEPLANGRSVLKVLASADKTQAVVDLLERRYSSAAGFRLVLIPVEASLPLPEDGQPEPATESSPTSPPDRSRLSREELYADVHDGVVVSPAYVVMVILSAIVASVGILRDNLAVIIGAMVVAPLLGPNVALSLATALADAGLAARALRANLIGVATALTLAVALGYLLTVDPTVQAVASRTEVGLSDIVLALAAGSAAVLALTSGAPAPLIGVMVAVALLPPLVTAGLLAGAGHTALAVQALLLTLANVICVNLAGVCTLVAQGVRPARWCEAAAARRMTFVAISVWSLLLVALAVILYLLRAT